MRRVPRYGLTRTLLFTLPLFSIQHERAKHSIGYNNNNINNWIFLKWGSAVHATGKCKRGYWLVTNCKFNMVFPSTCPFSVAKIYFKNACLYKVRLKIILLENPEKQPSWQPMLLHFQSIDVSLCNLQIVCSETFIFTFILYGYTILRGFHINNIYEYYIVLFKSYIKTRSVSTQKVRLSTNNDIFGKFIYIAKDCQNKCKQYTILFIFAVIIRLKWYLNIN